MLKSAAAVIAAMLAMNPMFASSQPLAPLDVPVVIGGERDYDACAGVGTVAGLNPRGDGFLSVRSRPSRLGREIDRLVNGDRVYLCGGTALWSAIVYPVGEKNCGVGSPWPKRQAYTSPCKHGWVRSRYVKLIAG